MAHPLATSPLWQLVVSRFRMFFREPSAVFWTFGFPLALVRAVDPVLTWCSSSCRGLSAGLTPVAFAVPCEENRFFQLAAFLNDPYDIPKSFLRVVLDNETRRSGGREGRAHGCSH